MNPLLQSKCKLRNYKIKYNIIKFCLPDQHINKLMLKLVFIWEKIFFKSTALKKWKFKWLGTINIQVEIVEL